MNINLIEKYKSLTGEYNSLLNSYVSSYIKCLKNSHKSYTQRTLIEIANYCMCFDKFLYVCYPDITLEDIKENHIREYQNFCLESLKNSSKTINKKIRYVRYLFTYIKNYWHNIEFNPALQIPYVKYDEKPPKYISQSELKMIIGTMYDFKYGVRDVCITRFLSEMGIRLDEAFALTIANVDIDKREISINRNDTIYTFPLSNNLYLELREYLVLRDKFLRDNNTSLFISNIGTSYTIRAYQKRFKEAVIKCDFKETYTPRNVRAYFCYRMAENVEPVKLSSILTQRKVNQYYIDDIKSIF